MKGQFTTAKASDCANVSSNSSRAEKACGWYGGHPRFTAVISNSNCSEDQERTYKVTRGPHYYADVTMAVPELHYFIETAFTSYFLRRVSWVIGK